MLKGYMVRKRLGTPGLGGLYICAVWLGILKFEQTSLFCSASYLNSEGEWSFVSEGLSPSKTPHGYGTV